MTTLKSYLPRWLTFQKVCLLTNRVCKLKVFYLPRLAPACLSQAFIHNEFCLSSLKHSLVSVRWELGEGCHFTSPMTEDLHCGFTVLFVLFRVMASSQTVSLTLASQARTEAARTLRGKGQCCHLWKRHRAGFPLYYLFTFN